MRNPADRPATPRRPAPGAWALTSSFAILLAFALPGVAAAADAAPPATRPAVEHSDKIARQFADLAHPEPAVREAARIELMGISKGDLGKLKRLVAESGPLMPAQAVVLRDIVTHAYLGANTYPASREGFLGVRLPIRSFYTNFLNLRQAAPVIREGQFAPEPDGVAGVAILERMRGFAGSRYLEDGDVILGIEERPNVRLRDSEDLSMAVRAAGAGQTLHFQILRQGQVVRAPVTLDPRPSMANADFDMDDLIRERVAASDEYWDREFAPLVEGGREGAHAGDTSLAK